MYRNGYNGAALKTDVPWKTWTAGSNPAAGACGMYVPHNPLGLLLSAARTILLRAERDRPAALTGLCKPGSRRIPLLVVNLRLLSSVQPLETHAAQQRHCTVLADIRWTSAAQNRKSGLWRRRTTIKHTSRGKVSQSWRYRLILEHSRRFTESFWESSNDWRCYGRQQIRLLVVNNGGLIPLFSI